MIMAKNIPWQDRPEGCKDIVWRYSENPVIDRYSIASQVQRRILRAVPRGNEARVCPHSGLGMGLSGMKLLPWAVNASVTEITFENDLFMVTKAPQYKHLQELKTELPKNV